MTIKFAVVRWYTDMEDKPRCVLLDHKVKSIEEAEKYRENFLKDWPKFSPQNVQTLSYEV